MYWLSAFRYVYKLDISLKLKAYVTRNKRRIEFDRIVFPNLRRNSSYRKLPYVRKRKYKVQT